MLARKISVAVSILFVLLISSTSIFASDFSSFKNAIDNNDINELKKLADIDANISNEDGYTVLMHAAGGGNTEMVRILIDAGADVNASNNTGATALMCAAENPDSNIAKTLIEAGANVNAQGNADDTALMHAILWNSNLDVVKVLIEAGADINARDNRGRTSLMFALGNRKDADTIKYLLDSGANVKAKSDDGGTALMVAACTCNDVDIIKLLIEATDNIDVKDDYGRTALLYAVANTNNIDIIKLFIENGANVNSIDANGMSVMMVAISRNNNDIINLLIEAGAGTDSRLREVANELGIPFDNLKAFVNTFYIADEPANDVLVVDPDMYYQEYDNNEILADRKYEGKTLRMTITFKEIGYPLSYDNDYAAVSEEGGAFGINFGLLPEYNDILSTLQPGQRIIIEGVGSGYVAYINDCKIVQILD